MREVLFVCTANICRSPMADTIFNELARERGAVLRAQSAGVSALVGEEIAENSMKVLQEIGIPMDHEHRARQVSPELVGEADIILAMSSQHVAALRKQFPGEAGKIHKLPDYALGLSDAESISDPYGHSIASYRASVRQIFEYVEQALDRMQRA